MHPHWVLHILTGKNPYCWSHPFKVCPKHLTKTRLASMSILVQYEAILVIGGSSTEHILLGIKKPGRPNNQLVSLMRRALRNHMITFFVEHWDCIPPNHNTHAWNTTQPRNYTSSMLRLDPYNEIPLTRPYHCINRITGGSPCTTAVLEAQGKGMEELLENEWVDCWNIYTLWMA